MTNQAAEMVRERKTATRAEYRRAATRFPIRVHEASGIPRRFHPSRPDSGSSLFSGRAARHNFNSADENVCVPPLGAFAGRNAMPDTNEPILQVYAAGATTVVGFGDRAVMDEVNLAVCREQLASLLKSNSSHTLGFDLTGVRIVPSGFLGLMASVRHMGVAVHLYNPSPDVREVLSTTNLDRLMELHEVDLTSLKDSGE
jgi:anti-sigma B factor antagonist